MIEFDQKKFITALNEVAATDSGKVVIAMLKDTCRWDATFLSSEDPQVTQFYASQRGIYGALRQHIKQEHLIPIEFKYKRKQDDGRTQHSDTRTKSRRSTKRADK